MAIELGEVQERVHFLGREFSIDTGVKGLIRVGLVAVKATTMFQKPGHPVTVDFSRPIMASIYTDPTLVDPHRFITNEERLEEIVESELDYLSREISA